MHLKCKISTIQGRKHCEKRRNWLLQVISPFSHNVFHSFNSIVCQNAALCGNGLMNISHITVTLHIFMFFLGFISTRFGLWRVLPKETPMKTQWVVGPMSYSRSRFLHFTTEPHRATTTWGKKKIFENIVGTKENVGNNHEQIIPVLFPVSHSMYQHIRNQSQKHKVDSTILCKHYQLF